MAVREPDHYPPRSSTKNCGPNGGGLDDEHEVVKVETGCEPRVATIPVVGRATDEEEEVDEGGKRE